MAEVEEFANEHGVLYNDRVEAPSGVDGRYLRWRWRSGAGVVAIPVLGTTVGLCAAFRYPIGSVSLEFPRGAAQAGESPEAAAARELREETGLEGDSAHILGELFPDTGLIENPLRVVTVRVRGTRAEARPESMESIGRAIRWLTRSAVDRAVRTQDIRCGITVSAAALYFGLGVEA